MTYLDLFRKSGYRVYIKHNRYYPKLASPVSKREAEFEGYCLSDAESRGGLTQVEIHQNGKLVSKGQALCSEKDNYSKFYGRELALERALSNFISQVKVIK